MAERLAASLRKFELPYALFEVPTVHRSISTKGTDDLSYSKPRFIDFAFGLFKRPILYLDADCYFCEQPRLIAALPDAAVDFAIYNWLSDVVNDAWVPIEQGRADNAAMPARFWRFGTCVDAFSTTQLICSGCVQYWNNSAASLRLLKDWELTLSKFPRSPDDECLDFAFNMGPHAKEKLHYRWLPKEYARYAFWIYVRPVINHPDIPTQMNPEHFDSLESKRFDAAQVRTALGKRHPFPRDGVIDAAARILFLRKPDGRYAPASSISVPLYVGLAP